MIEIEKRLRKFRIYLNFLLIQKDFLFFVNSVMDKKQWLSSKKIVQSLSHNFRNFSQRWKMNEYLRLKKMENLFHILSKMIVFVNLWNKYNIYFVNNFYYANNPPQRTCFPSWKNPESIELIDVRNTSEYTEVHIPEAKTYHFIYFQ